MTIFIGKSVLKPFKAKTDIGPPKVFWDGLKKESKALSDANKMTTTGAKVSLLTYSIKYLQKQVVWGNKSCILLTVLVAS